MIIGACGYADTGSSAVYALLQEYQSTSCFNDSEFLIVHNPDGLEDLEHQLFSHATKYTSSTVAIERFRRVAYFLFRNRSTDNESLNANMKAVDEFVDKITQVRWNGCGFVDNMLFAGRNYKSRMFRFGTRVERKLCDLGIVKQTKEHDLRCYHTLNFSMYPEGFMDEARNLIEKILKNYELDFDKKIVLDQPFCGNDPVRSFRFYPDECKAIVVDRDPRDLYIHFRYFASKRYMPMYAPIFDIDKFIAFYRIQRERTVRTQDEGNVLRINLADMIYKYDDTVELVEEFCELNPADHTRKLQIFQPSKSIANTQLFRRFPEYKDEVCKIEKELSEYIYPYDSFKDADTSGMLMYE